MRTTVPPTPAVAPVSAATQQLNHLSTLSGLSGYECQLVAALKALRPEALNAHHKAVLKALWQKHGGGFKHALR